MLLTYFNKTNCELPHTAAYQHLQSEFLLAAYGSTYYQGLKSDVLQVPHSETAANIKAT